MKLHRLAAGNKLELSRPEWQAIGRAAGWLRAAGNGNPDGAKPNDKVRVIRGQRPAYEGKVGTLVRIDKEGTPTEAYVVSLPGVYESIWATQIQRAAAMRPDRPDPFAGWKQALQQAIIQKIKELQADGTVSMSERNLRAVVRPPNGGPSGTNVQWVYAHTFHELVETLPAPFGSFVNPRERI